MDDYTLIEFSWRKGVKNVVCHLLAPRKTISLREVEETRSFVVAIDGVLELGKTMKPLMDAGLKKIGEVIVCM